MLQPNYALARQYATQRLETELDPRLTYHNVNHTLGDVLPAIERFAAIEAIEGEMLLLLRTAALYHDVGYIERRAGHERASIAIMADVLPEFGYTAAQIDVIRGLILATQMPQSPKNHHEALMADADLDVLGRSDFMKRSLALRAELAEFGTSMPIQEWYVRQIEFLSAHRYFTSTARTLRNPGIQRNISLLKILVATSFQGNP